MKYNARQLKAIMNIKHAANWLIGGMENCVSDFGNEPEGIQAKEELANHEMLVNEVYDMAISDIYNDGAMYFGEGAKKYLKDVRFCGKDWLMEICDKIVKKMGY